VVFVYFVVRGVLFSLLELEGKGDLGRAESLLNVHLDRVLEQSLALFQEIALGMLVHVVIPRHDQGSDEHSGPQPQGSPDEHIGGGIAAARGECIAECRSHAQANQTREDDDPRPFAAVHPRSIVVVVQVPVMLLFGILLGVAHPVKKVEVARAGFGVMGVVALVAVVLKKKRVGLGHEGRQEHPTKIKKGREADRGFEERTFGSHKGDYTHKKCVIRTKTMKCFPL
jgi:hypothetical protein